nr:pneumococcal-type histidine triad protein [Aerococcus mictus]
MEKKNIKQAILACSASALLLGGGYYWGYSQGHSGNESGINYVADQGLEKDGAEVKKLSHADDEIEAEQIVVKITDDGYVTSHGDHFHYYNGKVPYDAIISEELIMRDPNYKLRQEDIVNEVRDGYIIKVNGKYYLYLKDPNKAVNVRTKEEIEEQRKLHNVKEDGSHGGHAMTKAEAQAVQAAKAQGRYTTDDGYVFTVGSIVQDTGDAYICAHGDHFHYVPKADLSPAERAAAAAYMAGRSGTSQSGSAGPSHSSGQSIVSQRLNNSPYAGLVNGNNNWQNPQGASGQTSPQHQANQQSPQASQGQRPGLDGLLDQLYKLPMNQRHVESDGLVFDPVKVTKRNNFGYVLPHGDHFHIIPFNQLSDLEIAATEAYLKSGNYNYQAPKDHSKTTASNKKPQTGPQPEKKDQASPGQKEPAGQKNQDHGQGKKDQGKDLSPLEEARRQGRYTTDDGYIFTPESIVSDQGDGYICQHGDHFHYVPKDDLSANERAQAKAYLNKSSGQAGAEQEQTEKVIKPLDPVRPQVNKPGFKPSQIDHPQESEAQPQKDLNQSQANSQKTLEQMLDELYALPLKERHREGDGLLFDPMKVTRKTKFGYVHPHGDHHHVIPLQELSALEIAATEAHLNNPSYIYQAGKTDQESKPSDSHGEEINSQADESKKPASQLENSQEEKDQDKVNFLALAQKIAKSAKGKDHKTYTTDDGYRFSPESIVEYDSKGFITQHGDHSHYVPFADLDDEEIRQAQDYVNSGKKVIKFVEASQDSADEIDKKLSLIALESGINKADLKVTGNKVIVPHGNHSHLKNLSDYPSYLRASDFSTVEEYKDYILGLKLSQFKLAHGLQDKEVLRDGDQLFAVLADKTIAKKLDEITLSIDYETVSFSSSKNDQDEKKEEIVAEQPQATPIPEGLFTPQQLAAVNIQMAYPEREENGAFLVYHIDHWHKIENIHLNAWFNQDKEKIEKAKASMRYLIAHPEAKMPPKNGFGVPHNQSADDKDFYVTFNGKKYKAFGKGLQAGPYNTGSEGYVFSKDNILGVDDHGVTTEHREDGHAHTHYIEFGELKGYELAQVEEWMEEQGIAVEKTKNQSPQIDPESVVPDKRDDRYVFEGENGKEFYVYPFELRPEQIAAVEAVLARKALDPQAVISKDDDGYHFKVNGKSVVYPAEALSDYQVEKIERQLFLKNFQADKVLSRFSRGYLFQFDQGNQYFSQSELSKEQIAAVEEVLQQRNSKAPDNEPATDSKAAAEQKNDAERIETAKEAFLASHGFNPEEVKSRTAGGYIFEIFGTEYKLTVYKPESGQAKKASELSPDQVAAVEAVLKSREQERAKLTSESNHNPSLDHSEDKKGLAENVLTEAVNSENTEAEKIDDQQVLPENSETNLPTAIQATD